MKEEQDGKHEAITQAKPVSHFTYLIKNWKYVNETVLQSEASDQLEVAKTFTSAELEVGWRVFKESFGEIFPTAFIHADLQC